MARTNFENLQVYQVSERLADRIWHIVSEWHHFPRDTVGKQLVRAADSIGANIAEGSGRGSFQDNRRFIRIARASLYEKKTLAPPSIQSKTDQRRKRRCDKTARCSKTERISEVNRRLKSATQADAATDSSN
jgi:four helix bundle protein